MFADRKKLVMCQVCRGLIEASAKSCPLCGRESVPRARLSTANITESGNFFSLIILTINVVLFGLMAVYGYRQGGSFGRALMKQMLIWGAIGIMFGFLIGANNVAHVGGFIAGAGLGFVLEPDSPVTSDSAARWNAVAIACIALVAISFVMAGRAYGTEQEKVNKLEVIRRRHQNAYELAQTVDQARLAINESLNLNRGSPDRNTALQVAAQLRQAAADLEKATFVDDRSTEIKSRLVVLINKRAQAFDQATNDRTLSEAAETDFDALRAAFGDFNSWVSDAAQEFERLEEQ